MAKQLLIIVLLFSLLLFREIFTIYADDNLKEGTAKEVLHTLKKQFHSPLQASLRGGGHPEILKGVTFSRTFTHFPNNASFDMYMDGHHCQERDEFGDNQCHFEWGEDASGNYTMEFVDDIQAGDFVTGSLKVCMNSKTQSVETLDRPHSY